MNNSCFIKIIYHAKFFMLSETSNYVDMLYNDKDNFYQYNYSDMNYQ